MNEEEEWCQVIHGILSSYAAALKVLETEWNDIDDGSINELAHDFLVYQIRGVGFIKDGVNYSSWLAGSYYILTKYKFTSKTSFAQGQGRKQRYHNFYFDWNLIAKSSAIEKLSLGYCNDITSFCSFLHSYANFEVTSWQRWNLKRIFNLHLQVGCTTSYL